MELARTEPPELGDAPAVADATDALAALPHDDAVAVGDAVAALVAAAEGAVSGVPADTDGAPTVAPPTESAAVSSPAGDADTAGRSPAELVLLSVPDTPEIAEAVRRSGFEAQRDLVQLRRALPLEPDLVASARTLPLRPFEPGEDDDAWLRVNNRAFDWHPEQGGWRPEDLAARMAEPWFDPEGFLVLDGPEGTMYGFCWTKVHPPTDEDPALGEIFVIGVDPAAHGLGMGRALVVAGLDHLASAGLRTAMLYTEADNGSAMGLYRSLGFTDHEHTRWYHRSLASG